MFAQHNPAARPITLAAVLDSGPSSSGSGPVFSSRRSGPSLSPRSGLPSPPTSAYVNIGTMTSAMPMHRLPPPPPGTTTSPLTSSPEIVTMEEFLNMADRIEDAINAHVDKIQELETIYTRLDFKLQRLEGQIAEFNTRISALETSAPKPNSVKAARVLLSPRRARRV